VGIQLTRLTQRIEEAGYQLEVTPAARTLLAEAGYDPVYGARPLKRVIQRELQDPLALRLLQGEFRPGETIRVDADAGGWKFTAVVEGKTAAA